VFDARDIFADPHFRVRDMLVEVEQPGAARPLTVAGTPVRMSATPGGVRRRAPMVGEHTERTLADFGFTATEIAALRP
jgi:formyl-CoA transferase